MIVAQLDSYGATISGWETQQASGDFDAIYRRADAAMGISNELILQPNSEMQKINAAVERAQEAEAQASS